MELALSLGDPSKPFSLLGNTPKLSRSKDLGFCMGLGDGFKSQHKIDAFEAQSKGGDSDEKRVPSDLPLYLHLLPSSQTQLRIPCLTHKYGDGRGLDVNQLPPAAAAEEDDEESEEGAAISSPNSTVSSFRMDFGIRNGKNKGKRDLEVERVSDDDDENGSTRKKLRLSKEQSAFLEESFKEQNTLNPKQKLALAKQLNLRPRQVEVWFQNRRARTKLKQTEVDCEYLKRSCETLREENKRLQKELQELRVLKTCQPFYMQSPATTLTMCPSCERLATKGSAATAATGYPPFFSSANTCDPETSPSPPGNFFKSLDVTSEKT
ncbi:hypothetical protein Goari_018170 [Gossypium aridum]|uniref:Homeobox domain-containing protein n=2 Tax=Gossypium TaxID=3633 RepID=A0A7J8WPU0_GOSAI|nr:hypothetical protein [Gossypium aridum]